MKAEAKSLGVAVVWIKDRMIIQAIYTNVLHKDSTFDYSPSSGVVGPDPPIDPTDPPVDPPIDPTDPPVDPTDPENQQSSAGTIAASVIVLVAIFSVGTVGAVFVYKKSAGVRPVAEVIDNIPKTE